MSLSTTFSFSLLGSFATKVVIIQYFTMSKQRPISTSTKQTCEDRNQLAKSNYRKFRNIVFIKKCFGFF